MFEDLQEQCLHYLFLALSQDIGIILWCPNQNELAAALARVRYKNPVFKNLTIRIWENDEIAIVHKGVHYVPKKRKTQIKEFSDV